MTIGFAFNAAQVNNFNQQFQKIVRQRRKGINYAMRIARNNAIQEIKQWIDDTMSAYSETGEASRHFKFEKYTVMSGDNPIYGIKIKSAVDPDSSPDEDGQAPVGHFLLFGTKPHDIPKELESTYDPETRTFSDVDEKYLYFEQQDGSTYYGPGPVHHPGTRGHFTDLRDHTYYTLYKHLRLVGSNKYVLSMGTASGEAGPGADFDALEEE